MRACNERSRVGAGGGRGEERGNQSGFIIKALDPVQDVQYTITQNPSNPGPALLLSHSLIPGDLLPPEYLVLYVTVSDPVLGLRQCPG
jgi:hypothetical protein